MRRIVAQLLVFIVLLTNLNIPFSFANEIITENTSISESDWNSSDINKVLDETMQKTSVTDDVYQKRPRGRFLVRFNEGNSDKNASVVDSVYKDSGFNPSFRKMNTLDISSFKNDFEIENKLEQLQVTSDDIELYNVKSLESVNALYIELSTDEVNRLLVNPLVASIEEDKPIEIAETKLTDVEPQIVKESAQTIPWGVHSTGAYITQLTKGSGLAPVKVAVFDTGIMNHPDLNIAGGVSFVDSTNYFDDEGHGTHIAGTIGATNNGEGVVGVAPSAELYAVKVTDSSGQGYTSSVIQGIEWAIENDIDIINMSFVASQYSELLHEAIKQAKSNGIIIVAAAGNKGFGDNSIQYPAKYSEVVAVGAVDSSHHRLDFSATGEELDLVAPGFGVISTSSNGEYGVSSGTSSAAAHVTGTAALLWAHNRSMTSEEIIQKLYETATSLGNSNEYGHGLVNIARASGVTSGSIAPLSEENLTGLNNVFPTASDDYDIEISSYDKKNNGATIFPGEAVTVSLKLEGDQNGANPHTQVIVEVSSASNPGHIITSSIIQNPRLDVDISYTWQTTNTTPTGTYYIKYRYPGLASGNYDDTFIIYVAQPGVGPDTFEPNDTVFTAKSVLPGQSYTSYISSSSDIDYYKLTADKSGEISFTLNVPANVDYELSIYDESGIQVGRSSNGTGINEFIELEVVENQSYYIKVIGFSGQFSTLPYVLTLSLIEVQPFPAPNGLEAVPYSNSIKLSWNDSAGAISYLLRVDGVSAGTTTKSTHIFNGLEASRGYKLEVAAVYEGGTSRYASLEASTIIPELIVYQPEDIELTTGSTQMYSFRPATTGVYRFYTSSFKGLGALVDTQIGIYSDIQLSKLLASNDDANDTVFSESIISLVGGETYYVKIQGYDSTPLRARITADVVNSSIPYIQLNQAVDINEQAKDSNVYIFIPSESGSYRFTTNKYRGNSSSKNNDTELSVFSSPNMDVPITNGYNDDKRDSIYSEVVVNLSAGTPYYVRVNEVHGGKVYARLLVTSAGSTSFTKLDIGVPVDLSRPTGENAYLQFTPDVTAQYRFFTTNYSGSPLLNDTEISLYRDASLTSLVDSNDDAKGYRPYGELFSKLEVNLAAGTTYYLVVRSADRDGLQARFIVEDMSQSSIDAAQNISFDQVVATDKNGKPLSITSLYDVDYYKFELRQREQISIFLSEGKGAIEDAHGNIRGYFGLDEQQAFELNSGTYYLRVENDVIHFNRPTATWGFVGYSYELTVNINIIEYSIEASEISSFRIMSTANDTSLDATPGSKDQAKVKYTLTGNDSKIYIEVFTTYGRYPVYKAQETGSFRKNEQKTITWNGIVNPHSNFRSYFTNHAEINGLSRYYAKNGTYSLWVYRLDAKGRKTNVQEYILTVLNDPLNELNIVDPPPKTINGRNIVAGDKNKCTECIYYFNTNVLGPDDMISITAYDAWFEDMYGKTGLKKFWSTAEDLVLCNEDDPIDQLQCTADTLGMIPIIGDPIDAVNGVVYFIRGKNVEALMSAGAIIPVAGTFITAGGKTVKFTGAKIFQRIYKANPCGCLPEGTSITTAEGIKPIEDIQIGDLVLAKDPYTGIQAYKPVEHLFSNESDEIFTIEIGNTLIETTGNHPFWVNGKGWIPAEDLKPGDKVEDEDGNLLAINAITLGYETRQVYNFTVSDFHTYYVSELSILTHNLSQVCQIVNYKGVKPNLISGSKNKGSKLLADEIEAATGMKRPDGWDAHHIVALGSNNQYAKEIRDFLTVHKIDLNSSANGVYLPKDKGFSTTVIDGQTMATHNGGHAVSYYKFVRDQIFPVRNDPDAILEKLDFIRKELLEGRLEIGNIKK